ncbi:MAG: S-layer homology domain-containing protein, partial [Acidimicrobiaceae bacterium]|nr:S-layer homology domain-containing protein [Acidimicrobiaceae bacterium]
GVQDAGYANNEVSVSHSIDTANTADTEYDALSSLGSVTVTVTDDDSAGVTVSGTTLTVGEGSEGTYTVRLDAQPTGDVVVAVSSADTAAASVLPVKLTFTTSSWNTAQSVTVTGVQDVGYADNEVSVSHSIDTANTADTVYNALTSLGSVTVTVSDDDAAGVTVSETSLSVVESAPVRYTVVLDAQPADSVTVTATSQALDKATVSAALVFTTDNWFTPQTFTVIGVEAGSSSITHAAVSSDAGYQINALGTVIVTVTVPPQVFIPPPPPPPPPPTTLVLTTSADDNAVVEGASVIVTATLDQAAISAVLVTLTTAGTATESTDYTLPAAFTIAVGQTTASGTVQITDDETAEDSETIILTASSTGLTVTPVTLTITDTDPDDPDADTDDPDTDDPDTDDADTDDPDPDTDDPDTDDPDPDTDDPDTDDLDPDPDTDDPDTDDANTDDLDPDTDDPDADTDTDTDDPDTDPDDADPDDADPDDTDSYPDDGIDPGTGDVAFVRPVREALCELDATIEVEPFTDVPQSSFAHNDVACIFLLGVTTGTSSTTYSPKNTVTREQMASFLARLYEKLSGTPAPVTETPFTDVDEASFASADIGRIFGLGITTGTSSTTYSPKDPVTREQMATFLANLYRTLTIPHGSSETTP